MKTVTSISGGKSSAFVAANYPSDYNVFSLVRIEDKASQFPDKKIRQMVEDRIQAPFIATAEDDIIIYTILDLEQYLGRRIDWITGETFDEVLRNKGGWLPNKLHRYCTLFLKIDPLFYWWAENIGEPVKMQIGFRANERRRVKRMKEKLNAAGFLEHRATFGQYLSGRYKGKRKWENVEWQKPIFPMVENNIYRDKVQEFWQGKPVRFAPLNNCIHCFHKHPLLLKKQSIQFPNKFNWAASWEGDIKNYWRSDVKYQEIKDFKPQHEINFEDFNECDSGYCNY